MGQEASVDIQEAKTRAALRTKLTRTAPVAHPGGPPPPPVAPTVRQHRTDELAGRVSEKQAASDTSEIAPEIMTDAEARDVIGKRFQGQERSGTGALKDKRLRTAEASISTSDTLVRKLAKDGYGSLTVDQKTAVRDRIDNAISRLPGLSDLPPKGTPERQAYIEAWLSDPVNKVFYGELVKQEVAVLKGEDQAEDISEAKVEIDAAEAERSDIVKKIANVQELKEQADAALESFDTTPPTPGGHSKGEMIVIYEGLADSAQATLDAATTKLSVANKRLELLTHSKTALHADKTLNSADRLTELDKISTQEQALLAEINGAGGLAEQQAIAKAGVDRANKQLGTLVAERAKLQQVQDGLQVQWDNLLTEFNANGIRLDNAYAAQFETMGDITLLPDRLTRTIESAFIQTIEDRMTADATTFNEELAKIENEAKDAATKAITSGIRKRYFIPTKARGIQGIIHGHESTKYNKTLLRSDWGTFLTDDVLRAGAAGPDTPRGAEAIVEQVLLAGGMDPAEVANKLKDKEFMKDATSQVMSDLIRLRTRNGSKMSENEREYIGTFNWAEGAWQNALTKSAEGQKMLEEAQAQGLIEGKTFADLRRADRATILKILMAVFGAAALAAGTAGIGGLAAVGAGGASLGGAMFTKS